MPLEIVRNDITKMKVDAIVNATNNLLLGDGGVDGSIHRAAGPKLMEKCRALGGCRTGDAKITRAYDLPCKYVIHTVGPLWQGGGYGERETLVSCYRKSLALAKKYHCKTVAFPLISAGVRGYPKEQALRVAADTIGDFLAENEMKVYMVIFDKTAFNIGSKLFFDIAEYIDDNYVEAFAEPKRERLRRLEQTMSLYLDEDEMTAAPPIDELDHEEPTTKSDIDEKLIFDPDTGERIAPPSAPPHMREAKAAPFGREKSAGSFFTGTEGSTGVMPPFGAKAKSAEPDLGDMLKELDAGFSETLLKLIDRTGKKDSEIYKKANVDRKLFSKIRNNPDYKPSKTTALAFAIALELDIEETKDLLSRAGFALTHSSKFDVIIEYFIKRGQYNIFVINEALFAFDQSLLGV